MRFRILSARKYQARRVHPDASKAGLAERAKAQRHAKTLKIEELPSTIKESVKAYS